MTADAASDEPIVSIVSITYNHEAFIREALESFVTQDLDVPMEIIVADDASTDGTQAIIAEYADRYPHLFRPILRRRNVGIHQNLIDALSAARGRYIALCEGDDFWTDPLKLRRQVAFLDRHPDVSLCFHPVRVTWTDGRAEDAEFPPVRRRKNLSVEALLRRNFIQTNSAVYRRLDDYRDIPADVMPLDWYLHVRHGLGGDIAMLPETMAAYRRHAGGAWFHEAEDRARFWVAKFPGQVALYDAMLGLVSGNRKLEKIVYWYGSGLLLDTAKYAGKIDRAIVLDTVARHPRLLQHHLWQRVFLRMILRYQQLRQPALTSKAPRAEGS